MEKPKKYEDQLMNALAFDEDDLAANQMGQLSPRQRARLRSKRNTAVLTALLFALLLVVWLAAMPLATSLMPSNLIPALTLLTPVIALLVISFLATAYRLTAELREDRVLCAEGRIRLSLEYFINVGDMRFTANERTFLAFKNGDPYRIYYSRRLKKLLSVEWLRENDDNLLDVPPDDSASITEPDAADSASVPGERKLRR